MKRRMLIIISAIVTAALILPALLLNVFAAEKDTETEIIVASGAELFTGDANGDGIIDTADATAILRYIIHAGDINKEVSDCNGDGDIDTADATAILQYIIHIYTFPE